MSYLVKYYDEDYIVLNVLRLTFPNHFDLLANAPAKTKKVEIVRPTRTALLTVSELENLCGA